MRDKNLMETKAVQHLIFGQYNKYMILDAVNNYDWQVFRISLKGLSTESKVLKLKEWLKLNNNSHKAKVQVTNYVNALKRGGQIK